MLYDSSVFRPTVFPKVFLVRVLLWSVKALLVWLAVGGGFCSTVYATNHQVAATTERIHLQLSEGVVAAGATLWLQGVVDGDTKSTVLYVEVMSDQGAVWQGIYPIQERVARGSIMLSDTLASGWYQVRAYTQWMRNAGVTSFATRPLFVVNPDREDKEAPSDPSGSAKTSERAPTTSPREIAITLNQERYRPRDSVSVRMRWNSPSDTAIVAVSVRKIHSVDYYSTTAATVAAGTSNQVFRYPVEDQGLTVSGRVQETQGVARGRKVTLFIPGSNPYFEYNFVDSAGQFRIPIQSSWQGAEDVILQMFDTSIHVQWTLDEKFAPENTYVPSSFPILTDSVWQAWRTAYAQRALVMSPYTRQEDSAIVSLRRRPRFYGSPNYEIVLDEYTFLPTFLEINRELLVGVRLRERQNSYDMDVFDIPNRTFLEGEPSILMDGVIIHDVNYLVNFPPEQIERIETVNRRTYYGEHRFDGTVAVYSTSGDAYRPALPSSALSTELDLYSPYQAFAAPDSLALHEPDFRTLLYWQPNVALTNGPHVFGVTNADELGEFEVVVEGVTTDGQRVYGRQSYVVSIDTVP